MINKFSKPTSVILLISILVHFLALIYQLIIGILYSELLLKFDPNFPSLLYFPILSVLSILNIYFLFSILKFKKKGFWGFIFTQLISFLISLFIKDWVISVTYMFFFVLVLYTLQIGKEHYKWT